jgi:hypothetical protein
MENLISVAIDDNTRQTIPFKHDTNAGLSDSEILFRRAWADSRRNGTDKMTMDEINEIIAETREEMYAK